MSTDPEVHARDSGASVPPSPGETGAAASEQATGRRRDPVPSLAAAVVLLIALVVTGGPGVLSWFEADGERGLATIPDRIEGYSYLTGSLSPAPPGRAIAVYQHGFGVEFLDFPQAIVLAADADVYRRIDVAEGRSGARSQGDPAPVLPAPDGGRIAVGSYEKHGSLAVQDLTTGAVTRHPVTRGYSVVPLAWSPDGRYIAALELEEAMPFDDLNRIMSGPLVLFDLAESKVIRFAALSGVSMAAFAPDSRQFAVQQGTTLSVVDLTGTPLRELALRPGYVLATGTAWSPDGELLAIYSGYHHRDAALAFLDPTGSTRPTPPPIPAGWGPSLGWTGPRSLLVPGLTGRNDGTEGVYDTAIAEVDLSTGARDRVTWVDTDPDSYGLGQFHLATGLLPELQVRPVGDVDRGPWPVWFRILIGIPAALIAAILVLKLSTRSGGPLVLSAFFARG